MYCLYKLYESGNGALLDSRQRGRDAKSCWRGEERTDLAILWREPDIQHLFLDDRDPVCLVNDAFYRVSVRPGNESKPLRDSLASP